MLKEQPGLSKQCALQILLPVAKNLQLAKIFIVIDANYKFAIILTGRPRIANLATGQRSYRRFEVLR